MRHASPLDHDHDAASLAEVESPARTRKASPRKYAGLPKAPQGKLVAQRLMRNATMRPVQRFDSADYFLQQHNDRNKAAASTPASDDEDVSTAASASAAETAACSELEQPSPPPPLARDTANTGSSTGSPLPLKDDKPSS